MQLYFPIFQRSMWVLPLHFRGGFHSAVYMQHLASRSILKGGSTTNHLKHLLPNRLHKGRPVLMFVL